MKQKLYIKTYGCQMNVYDSQKMTDLLRVHGYEEVAAPDTANLVILNTCHIREKAAEKVYSELGRLKQLRKQRQTADADDVMVIGVAGCVAQAEGAEMQARAPFVDMVFGPQVYHRLPEMLTQVQRQRGKVLDTDFPVESKFDTLPLPENTHGAAFLTIQEGCDKFCAFCVVPYTRGAEFSRSPEAILREARALAAAGAKEITLLGQNVNAYHGEDASGAVWGLARLLYALADIVGIERLRYTTSHPRDMDADLYEAHRTIPQLMPFLHLPVQSGSNRILDMMNRKHSRELYLESIARLRDAQPDIAFSSDFIVGFPGESDRDFEQTLDLVRQISYAQAYSFMYSPRAGTPAALEDDQVPHHVKKERLAALQALLQEQQMAFNQQAVGQTVPVLFDRIGQQPGQLLGRTPHMQSVYVTADTALLGQIQMVEIQRAHPVSVFGTIVPSPSLALAG